MLQLYEKYRRQEVIDAFSSREDQILEFCDGEFVVVGRSILCLFGLGTVNRIYLTSPSRLVWMPQENGVSYVKDHTWLPKLVSETIDPISRQKTRSHYLFVHKDSEELFVFLGEVHLGSYGYSGVDGNRAYFSLNNRLPRSVWVSLGGSLEPKDTLDHLSVADKLAVPSYFHQNTLELLRLKLRQEPIYGSYFSQLEKFLRIKIPEAIREWYGLSDSMEIMNEIVGFNEPNQFNDVHYDLEWIEVQKRAATSMTLLPLIYENQWVWQIAVQLDADENPPVYFAYYDEDIMVWQQHAANFSDFIWAWAWDAQTFHRDFVICVSNDVTDQDIELIEQTFDRGPTTWASNQYFHYEEFYRFSKDGQVVTIGKTEAGRDVWFSARTKEAMERLLSIPLTKGNILSLHPNLDIEMARPFLL